MNSLLKRVVRGGSWFSSQDFRHAACRNCDFPEFRHDVIGFRLVGVEDE